MKTLCVIPARSGSKRLPDKATLPFAGTTLIEITCNQAVRLQKQGVFTDVVFTSDSVRYRAYADSCGVEYLRDRPPELATDDASSIDVVRDALEWVEKKKSVSYDTVCLLQVTSPLRLDEDVIGAVREYSGGRVKTITKRPYMVTGITPICALYQLNGAVFMYNTNNINDKDQFSFNPYEMPPERSIDIDTEFDFLVAQYIYENGLHK
jgi:CMP-N,N'-diacetyllegionaminic acid synthase